MNCGLRKSLPVRLRILRHVLVLERRISSGDCFNSFVFLTIPLTESETRCLVRVGC